MIDDLQTIKKHDLLHKYHSSVSHGNCVKGKLFSAMEKVHADIFAGHFTSPVIGFRSEIQIELLECRSWNKTITKMNVYPALHKNDRLLTKEKKIQ
uniref:Uncharacterized protein n=1 Tax=Wuchereria bancrofti TaxID=6293 RepID=A0A1I8E9F5_WUCBA